jgi:6-methylsalicylate decarboxylase
MMEFLFDETHAVANLLLSGTVSKYLHITFITSHCGATLPPLLDRVGSFASLVGAGDKTHEFRNLLRERFFFDMAGFPFPDQIHGLLRMLGDGGEKRLMYGSDYPFTPEKIVVKLVAAIDSRCEGLFSVEERRDIYSGNTRRLFGF